MTAFDPTTSELIVTLNDGPPVHHALGVSPDPQPDALIAEFPAERIAQGVTSTGEIVVTLTNAGRAACLAAEIPVECDFCRVTFAQGDGYYRMEIGMDEEASTAGGPSPLVEGVSEMVVCTRCEPVIARELDRFLEQLWALRAPDPVPYADDGEDSVTETVSLP